jgi:predicted dehydrogenase
MDKLGVAILGLDHWYSADHIAPAVINSGSVRLAAVSHDDVTKGQQLIRGAEDAFWTSDYRAALDRKDVDIVVVLYSTDRNVAICQEAAALGKHIVSVKPMALDLAGADAIVAAVRAAGVQFFPLESQRRLSPDGRRLKSWIDEGRIGRPLRFTQMLHGSLPMAWPGSSEAGWWTDPNRVPGGAWLDHAIYAVDTARWLLGSEMARVCGVSANQRYPELAVEDFGIATYTMDDGAVALIEDTWTADRGYGFSRSELFGSAGTISEDSNLRGAVALRGDFGLEGPLSLDLRREPRSLVVDHLAAVVRGEIAPAATVDDGRADLAACLAFYEAAREQKSVNIGD